MFNHKFTIKEDLEESVIDQFCQYDVSDDSELVLCLQYLGFNIPITKMLWLSVGFG